MNPMMAGTRLVMKYGIRPVYGPPMPIGMQRTLGDLASALQRMPRGVTATSVVLGGRTAKRFAGSDAADDRAVLWLHGGAFITGSTKTHGSLAAHLAKATGVPVYLLDYRLAPEHQHPAAVDDAVGALKLVPEANVVLGGDSAGGCLALLAADRGVRDLAGLALVSPLVDLTHATARAYEGEEVLVRADWAEQGVRAMFGHDLPVVPDPTVPLVVHVAEHERLRAEGEALARRTGAELVCVPGGWHDIHLQAAIVPAAKRAVDQLAGSINDFF
ncbi:MAG: alpha/beta hydrolase [Frankiales bacterium]|nr:alpha/beta hydrolase [Frankiales bacterium]